jgi:hypothetical protein
MVLSRHVMLLLLPGICQLLADSKGGTHHPLP